jgi:hypothetical protein
MIAGPQAYRFAEKIRESEFTIDFKCHRIADKKQVMIKKSKAKFQELSEEEQNEVMKAIEI